MILKFYNSFIGSISTGIFSVLYAFSLISNFVTMSSKKEFNASETFLSSLINLLFLKRTMLLPPTQPFSVNSGFPTFQKFLLSVTNDQFRFLKNSSFLFLYNLL